MYLDTVIKLQISPGEKLEDVIVQAVKVARVIECELQFMFNDWNFEVVGVGHDGPVTVFCGKSSFNCQSNDYIDTFAKKVCDSLKK